MIDLPFEIIVEIAEKSLTVWYLLSLSYKKFGFYSIQPFVLLKAKQRFNKEPILYVPFCFWDKPGYGLPLPIVSLQFHEVKLVLKPIESKMKTETRIVKHDFKK
jgi:hypothetical protein